MPGMAASPLGNVAGVYFSGDVTFFLLQFEIHLELGMKEEMLAEMFEWDTCYHHLFYVQQIF